MKEGWRNVRADESGLKHSNVIDMILRRICASSKVRFIQTIETDEKNLITTTEL